MASADATAEPDRRDTKQKNAIRDTFTSADRPLSPEEVLHSARAHVTNMGIATVYRSIKSLLLTGWLEPVEVPGQPARYEIAGKDHHHHFHCQICERVYEIDGCPDIVGVKAPNKFRVTGHHLTVFGICAGCDIPAKAKKGKRA